MASIQCKMCGGSLDLPEGLTYAECPYCSSAVTLPRITDSRKESLYNRAEDLRRANDFDKALQAYEKILEFDDSDPEIYWGVVLCRYGIEYVEDPISHERIPTCHRVQYESILSDSDYKSALACAGGGAYAYEDQANKIAEIQKRILAISAQEEPYDVFICYKESTDGGTRTKDSTVAQDIYYQLSNEGFRVFFARITLEDKVGQEYEPIIFAALNSAKVMLVIGSKKEYFEAVWVKNEWSRFLALMKKDRSKMLIPCYKDMDAYDIPAELSMLQSQDMSKIGFLQDLLRGIKKVLTVDNNKNANTQSQQAGNSVSTAVDDEDMLTTVKFHLSQDDFMQAQISCKEIIAKNPNNGWAYFYLMLAERGTKDARALLNYKGYDFIKQKADEKLLELLNHYEEEYKEYLEEKKNLRETLETQLGRVKQFIEISQANIALLVEYISCEKLLNAKVSSWNILNKIVKNINENVLMCDYQGAFLDVLNAAMYKEQNVLQGLSAVVQNSYALMYPALHNDFLGNIPANLNENTVNSLLQNFDVTEDVVTQIQAETQQLFASIGGLEEKKHMVQVYKRKRTIAIAVSIVIAVLMIASFVCFSVRAREKARIEQALKENYLKTNFFGNVVTEYYGSGGGYKGVSIPDSIKRISNNAFNKPNVEIWCIHIPSSVTEIDEGAFENCLVDRIEFEPGSPFAFDPSAREVYNRKNKKVISNVPSKLLMGDSYCLLKHNGSLIVPVGCTTVKEVYDDEKGKIKKVIIPETVTTIEKYAFRGWKNLESVTIPNSVTTIGDWAFSDCKNLESVTIPNSVTTIGERAFYGCEKLKSVTIPNGVTTIEKYAFGDCKNLESVTIPNSVTEIENSAFSNCKNLKSVTIPNSVTKIWNGAFEDCEKLESVTIPNGVTVIGDSAFSNCKNLKSVTIPHSVTKIENGAFEGCEKLESVTIPHSVTKIGWQAFYNCKNLKSVTIPNSVTKIENGAFKGCEKLESVTIPNSVTVIGDSAFSNCKNLKSVTIPNSVTKIGDEAFEGCKKLNYQAEKAIKRINRYAF